MIEPTVHRFAELFAQLGLPNDEASIRDFIHNCPPLAPHIRLEEAPCWTPAQAAMLRDSLSANADWAETVDQLNLALHSR